MLNLNTSYVQYQCLHQGWSDVETHDLICCQVSFNIRPPLMKTIDRSVETLGRECNLCSVISFI